MRTTLLTFPWRSFTEAVSVPLASRVWDFFRRSSQTPWLRGLKRPARAVPAGTPSTAKSATTWQLSKRPKRNGLLRGSVLWAGPKAG